MAFDLSRRSFFAGLGALIAAPAIVKASSLMPVTGGIITRPLIHRHAGMSLLTIDQITREAVQLFTNSNAFIQAIDKEYDDIFDESGRVLGSSLRIRLPPGDHWVTFHPPTFETEQLSFAAWEKGLGL